jgi:hypothetical protein
LACLLGREGFALLRRKLRDDGISFNFLIALDDDFLNDAPVQFSLDAIGVRKNRWDILRRFIRNFLNYRARARS